jgi:hypothetical protein
VATELIKKGMKVNVGNPLHGAISNKYVPPRPFFFSFLSYGNLINLVVLRCTSMVWLLVLSGADVNAKDEEGKTCWQLCEDDSIRKALCRIWSTDVFKWFPAELKSTIIRY